MLKPQCAALDLEPLQAVFPRDSGIWPSHIPMPARLTQPAAPGQGSPLRFDKRLACRQLCTLNLNPYMIYFEVALAPQQTVALVRSMILQTGMNTPAVIMPHEINYSLIGFGVRFEFILG